MQQLQQGHPRWTRLEARKRFPAADCTEEGSGKGHRRRRLGGISDGNPEDHLACDELYS